MRLGQACLTVPAQRHVKKAGGAGQPSDECPVLVDKGECERGERRVMCK